MAQVFERTTLEHGFCLLASDVPKSYTLNLKVALLQTFCYWFGSCNHKSMLNNGLFLTGYRGMGLFLFTYFLASGIPTNAKP